MSIYFALMKVIFSSKKRHFCMLLHYRTQSLLQMEMIVDAGSAAEIHAEDEKRFVIGWKFLRRRLYTAAAAHQAIIPASSKELQRYQVYKLGLHFLGGPLCNRTMRFAQGVSSKMIKLLHIHIWCNHVISKFFAKLDSLDIKLFFRW